MLSVLALISLTVFVNGDTGSSLLVETSSGFVRGKIVTGHTQKEVRVFHGIPYAEPPVGKFRFRPPIPVTPWAGVFDSTAESLPCYQQYSRESMRLNKKLNTITKRPWTENCLTVSVWTPVQAQKVPIVVLIHDGGFQTGTGVYPFMDLSTYSAEADIITISMNYRLGAFGFLSLGTSEYPGNVGLMDQHLALKWIHKNVNSFGGNSDAIFLYGIGAGAASVGHQTILSANEGLFKTAMLANGSPTCSWAWQTKEQAIALANHLSRNLGCDHSSTSSKIECLQNAHTEDILDANLIENENEHFKPNVDGSFIKEQPAQALRAGRMNNVSVISHSSFNAGSLEFFIKNEDIFAEQESSFTEDRFLESLKRGNLAQNDAEYRLIRDWYLKKDCPKNSNEIRDAAVRAYTDGTFECCLIEFLKYMTEAGAVTYKVVFDIPDPKFPDWIGAHSQVILSMYNGDTLDPRNQYGNDIRTLTMDTFKAAKIYTRKKASKLQELIPPFSMKDQEYMLRREKVQYLTNYRKEECVLWSEVLPALRKSHNRTCFSDKVVY